MPGAAASDHLQIAGPQLLPVAMRRPWRTAGMAVQETDQAETVGTESGLGARECHGVDRESIRRMLLVDGWLAGDQVHPARIDPTAQQGACLGLPRFAAQGDHRRAQIAAAVHVPGRRGVVHEAGRHPVTVAAALVSGETSRYTMRMPFEPLYGTPRVHRDPIGPLVPPLVRATTSGQPDTEALRACGAGERSGDFYQRVGHANGRLFESLVAELEGADGAVSFASGMAAMSAAILAFVGAGDRVLVAEEIYGGTSGLANVDLPRFGIQVERFSTLDLVTLDRALQRPAKFVVFETPINPTLRVIDLRAVTDRCRRAGVKTILDGTFAPPPIQRALEHGVDLIVHSATKFFGGHSDVLAGVVAGPHALLAPLDGFRRRTGGILAPDPAWLLCRSWPTLPLRLQAQQAAALALAQRLCERVGSGQIVGVSYPGLPDHPDRPIVERQMRGGGCVVSFEVAGGLERARAVLDGFHVIARAASLGGVESLATLPAFTTHAALDAAARRRAGIPDGLIRIAVGLEGADVLFDDIAQALGV